jgi:hypothetical protein
MASFLPVRPFGFPRTLRVFGGQTGYCQSLGSISASRAVHAIPTSRPQHCCPWVLFCLRFDPSTKAHGHLTQAFLPFSMSNLGGPFCPLHLWMERLQNVALLWRSSALRVWLPSQRFPRSPKPWTPLSGPNAPGFRPAKLCSFFVIRSGVSTQPLRSCASCRNLTTSTRRSSDFLPRKKPCLLPLGGLVQGETLALLGLLSSQAFSSLNHVRSFSLPTSPSHPYTMNWSPTSSHGASGIVLSATPHLPRKGVCLSGLSHRLSYPTS